MVFMALLPLKHIAFAKTQPHSSICINRLIEHNQSLKLGLLWILDLQSLTASDLLKASSTLRTPTCTLEWSAKWLSDAFHLTCLI